MHAVLNIGVVFVSGLERYRHDLPMILKGVSFTVPAGSKVGVAKSSIFILLSHQAFSTIPTSLQHFPSLI